LSFLVKGVKDENTTGRFAKVKNPKGTRRVFDAKFFDSKADRGHGLRTNKVRSLGENSSQEERFLAYMFR
jgi:hypothetical protein